MLTHNFRWSHAAGNQVVPSPWQATDVSVSLTTTTHSPQQHTAVWDLLLQSDPEGPTFISDTAQKSSCLFYIQTSPFLS
jgi:hypothetical protein